VFALSVHDGSVAYRRIECSNVASPGDCALTNCLASGDSESLANAPAAKPSGSVAVAETVALDARYSRRVTLSIVLGVLVAHAVTPVAAVVMSVGPNTICPAVASSTAGGAVMVSGSDIGGVVESVVNGRSMPQIAIW